MTPSSTTATGDFADTVQCEPPAPVAVTGAGDSLPAAESDIGLDLGAESEGSVAEKPTLSHIGRYALKALLGEGGLGRVYEAWDPLLSRTVAVKTLQFDLDMPSRIALDRLLLNEARAAANLNHPHIVTVFDAGLSAHGVYIAMERLRGRDLREMLKDGWRPAPASAAQIVRRVADALAYAHSRGVVHCDIKPGNIFVTRKEKPKVLDFGIARAAHASAVPSTEMLIAGSPHYLAPEQLNGGTIDARTDIYALGVVLYELLAGCKAFPGDSLEQIHAAVRAGQPVPLAELCPDVPAGLAAVVMQAMAPDAAKRPQTAAELSQSLRPWAATAAEQAPNPASPSSGTRFRWAGALLAAGVMTVAAFVFLRGGPGGPHVEALATAPQATQSMAAPARRAASGAAMATPQPTAPVPAVPPEGAAQAAAAHTDTSNGHADAAPAAPAAKPKAKPESKAKADSKARPPAASQDKPKSPVAPVTGVVQIAVSPWGEVEVDGRPAGTTPPLTRLTLPEGTHTITLRNADFAPHTATVQVKGDLPVVVRHRFGS